MTTPSLAKIERVDLHVAWPHEAYDFTPWLAENIAELGDALGMDLELQQTEAAVGGYSLDVLATDLNQNRPVIIENQLEATNHDHLGKLLTYAAGYDANVIVWLPREFRDEHRQALDWLNQRTGENTQFFGVVVELWRIAGSPPAPHFNLVATPNDWRKKTATSMANGGASRWNEARRWSMRFAQNIRHNNDLNGLVVECAKEAFEHRANVKMMNGRHAHCFLFDDGSRLAFSNDGYNGYGPRAWTYLGKDDTQRQTAAMSTSPSVEPMTPNIEANELIPNPFASQSPTQEQATLE